MNGALSSRWIRQLYIEFNENGSNWPVPFLCEVLCPIKQNAQLLINAEKCVIIDNAHNAQRRALNKEVEMN